MNIPTKYRCLMLVLVAQSASLDAMSGRVSSRLRAMAGGLSDDDVEFYCSDDSSAHSDSTFVTSGSGAEIDPDDFSDEWFMPCRPQEEVAVASVSVEDTHFKEAYIASVIAWWHKEPSAPTQRQRDIILRLQDATNSFTWQEIFGLEQELEGNVAQVVAVAHTTQAVSELRIAEDAAADYERRFLERALAKRVPRRLKIKGKKK